MRKLMFLAAMALVAAMPGRSVGAPSGIEPLERAAEAGDTDAQYALAVRLGSGDGVETDQERARVWLLRAAEGGHAVAQSQLGTLLLDSPDETQRAAALEWLEKAAAQGDMHANMQLGVRAADAGERDKALAHFERAAEVGDAETQLALATMYERGELAPADSLRALHWYRASAAGGNRYAQHRLGSLYAEGEAVERDAAAAYVWMWLALRGDPDDPARAMVAQWLTPRLREQLEAGARAWTAGGDVPSMPIDMGPPAPTTGRITVTVFDYASLGPEGGLPPSREEHWRIVDALALRHDGGRSSVLLSTGLIEPAAVEDIANATFGLASLPGLTLHVNADGSLASGMFNQSGDYVELLVAAVQADIEVDARGVRGRVSLPRDSAQFEETRYSIEVQFDAPFHRRAP